MDEFRLYSHKRKYVKPLVAQTFVAQKRYPVIRARVSAELESRIKNVAEEKGLSISEMTRILWENYLEKKFQKEWREEVNQW